MAASESLGALVLGLLEGGPAVQAPAVQGPVRERLTSTSRGERRYLLECWEWRPLEGEQSRAYVLYGGAGSARTVLSAEGEPIAHAQRAGRGFSPEFRAWIAAAVAEDRARCGF